MESLMGNKLYVGNLPYSYRDSDMEQAFSQYGTVSSAKGSASIELLTSQMPQRYSLCSVFLTGLAQSIKHLGYSSPPSMPTGRLRKRYLSQIEFENPALLPKLRNLLSNIAQVSIFRL